MTSSFDLAEYQRFIAGKAAATSDAGFEPVGLPGRLFPHQRSAVEFACRKGRAALFLAEAEASKGTLFDAETMAAG